MSVSRRSAPRASRPYVRTLYREVAGRMLAVIPDRGPCGCAGSPCQIRILYYRGRKTGIPWGSVAVAICMVHGLSFTLYPPGHVPYGREPWVPLGPDGSVLDPGEGEEACRTSTGYFDAAKDAAEGELWPVDSAPTPPDAVRSSQRRRVARTAALFGFERDLPAGCEAVADVTHLPAGEFLEVLSRLALTRDLILRGRELWDLVVRVTRLAGRVLMDRFAVLGHLAGLWGRPYRWRPGSSVLLELGRPFWPEGLPGTTGSSATQTAIGGAYDFGAGPPT